MKTRQHKTFKEQTLVRLPLAEWDCPGYVRWCRRWGRWSQCWEGSAGVGDPAVGSLSD